MLKGLKLFTLSVFVLYVIGALLYPSLFQSGREGMALGTAETLDCESFGVGVRSPGKIPVADAEDPGSPLVVWVWSITSTVVPTSTLYTVTFASTEDIIFTNEESVDSPPSAVLPLGKDSSTAQRALFYVSHLAPKAASTTITISLSPVESSTTLGSSLSSISSTDCPTKLVLDLETHFSYYLRQFFTLLFSASWIPWLSGGIALLLMVQQQIVEQERKRTEAKEQIWKLDSLPTDRLLYESKELWQKHPIYRSLIKHKLQSLPSSQSVLKALGREVSRGSEGGFEELAQDSFLSDALGISTSDEKNLQKLFLCLCAPPEATQYKTVFNDVLAGVRTLGGAGIDEIVKRLYSLWCYANTFPASELLSVARDAGEGGMYLAARLALEGRTKNSCLYNEWQKTRDLYTPRFNHFHLAASSPPIPIDEPTPFGVLYAEKDVGLLRPLRGTKELFWPGHSVYRELVNSRFGPSSHFIVASSGSGRSAIVLVGSYNLSFTVHGASLQSILHLGLESVDNLSVSLVSGLRHAIRKSVLFLLSEAPSLLLSMPEGQLGILKGVLVDSIKPLELYEHHIHKLESEDRRLLWKIFQEAPVYPWPDCEQEVLNHVRLLRNSIWSSMYLWVDVSPHLGSELQHKAIERIMFDWRSYIGVDWFFPQILIDRASGEGNDVRAGDVDVLELTWGRDDLVSLVRHRVTAVRSGLSQQRSIDQIVEQIVDSAQNPRDVMIKGSYLWNQIQQEQY